MAVDDDPLRTASLWQTAKAVLSAFFGVRRARDHASVRLNPVNVVIVGVAAAAVFVLTLLTAVRFIIGMVS